MKKPIPILLLWMFILSAMPSIAQTVGENMIEDFESTHVTTWTSDVAGTLSQPISNSVAGVGNSSANIASYRRNAGIQYDYVVSTLSGSVNNIAAYLDGSKKFSMKVYTSAPIGTTIDLSIENTAAASTGYPNGRHSVYRATTTAQNAWTTLIFDFLFQPASWTDGSTLNQLTMSFNNNSFTNDLYYFDDIKGFSVTVPVAPTVPSTEHLWDNFRSVRRVNYGPIDGTLSTASNPSQTGNAAATVGKYIRSSNQYDTYCANFDSTLSDLAAYKANTKKFSIKVFSPAIGTRIGFTLQDSLAALSGYPTGRYAEFSGTTTTANAWEKVVLTYTGTPDASVANNSVNQLAILVNANTFSPVTLYLDSLFGPKFAAPPVEVVLGQNLIQDFDGGNKLSFGFRNGTLTQPVTNTDMTSGNASGHFATYVRNGGAQYDVIVCDMLGISNDISNYVNGTKKVTMKVFTTAPIGTRVEFTLQNATRATAGYPTGRHSVYGANTTVTNAWETLTFTYFLAPDNSVDITTLDQMIISFNPNSFTSHTYKFDDIKGFPIVEYNDPTPHYEHIWDNFKDKRNVRYGANSGYSIVANPNLTGNNATTVGKYVRSANANDTLVMKIDSVVSGLSAYVANTKKFSLRVLSPAPNTTIQFTLQDSNSIGGSSTSGRYAEFSGATTTTGEWETVVLTYRFSPDNTVPTSSINQVAVLINMSTPAVATVYLDSIYGPMFAAPPTPAIVGENVIEDFESIRKMSYGVSAGVVTQPFSNPFINASNTSANVGKYERNAGIQYDYMVGTVNGQALDVASYLSGAKKFSMKVYTNAPVGTGIDLTLQNHTQALGGYPTGRHSVYHATVSASNTWTTLTFTFATQPSSSVSATALDEIVLAFNSNSFTNYTYYFDDLKGIDFCSAPTVPVISANTSSLVICNSGTIALTSSNPNFNVWSTGEVTRSIYVSAAGTYTVRTSNFNGSCVSGNSAPAVVTVSTNPTPTIIAGGPTTLCTGGTVTLTSSASSGNIWSNGATTRSIIVSTAGNYTVRAASSSTCTSSNSAPTAVAVLATLPTPSIRVSGATTIIAGTSVSLSGPADEAGYIWSNGLTTQTINVTTAGSYTVRTVSGSGCTSTASNPVTITVLTNATQWNGSTWSNGTPTSSLNAFVASPLTTASSMTAASLTANANVTLGANFTVLGTVSTSSTSSIAGTGTLVLAGSSNQAISGNLTNVTLSNSTGATVNNATKINGKLTLNSGTLAAGSVGFLTFNATATSQPSIDDYSSGNTGTISGSYNFQVWSGNAYTYPTQRHIAGPVATASRNAITNIASQYDYQESNASWNFMSASALNSSLASAKSFLGAATGNVAIGFYGTHVSGTVNAPLARTNGVSTTAVQLGFNAIGNPYPSTIDWSLVKNIAGNTTNTNGTAWIFRGGQYVTIDKNGVSSSTTGSKFLAAGQGFLLRKSTLTSNANLVFNNSIRVSNTSSLFREEALAENLRIRLSSTTNDVSDEIHIYGSNDATTGIDALDAEKIISPIATAPALYANVSSQPLSLVAMPLLTGVDRTIAVEAVINATGTYTLSNIEMGTFPVGVDILLEDKTEGIIQPLSKEYSFSANAGTTRKFNIHFTTNGSVNGAGKVNVYTSNDMLNVAFSNKELTNSTITVLNTLGQVVSSVPANGQNLVTIPMNMPAGVYIVKVIGDNCKTSTRVLWSGR